MATVGPSVRRRRLGAYIRDLREQASKTQHDAAEHIGCSSGKIHNQETGRSSIKKMELSGLLDFYRAPTETRELLEDLRKGSGDRGWWSTYRLPRWFQPYVGLETDANLVCNFEPNIIPGLLQTEEYAREIHSAGDHITDQADVAKRVAARLERQRRLIDSNPLEFRAVLGEEALGRLIGGPDVMAEQMQRILELAVLPNVMVQVIPQAAGKHASMTGGFAVLSFPEQVVPDVGYMDHPLGGHVIEDHDDVATLRCLFDEVRGAAAPIGESLALVSKIQNQHKAR